MIELPRPKQHLIDYGKRYEDIWDFVDRIRAGRGREYPNWPNWCFLPFGAFQRFINLIAKDKLSPEEFSLPVRTKFPPRDACILNALACWRVSQGIYRFDPALYKPLIDTPISGDIPCEILYQLPQWGIYIETPGLTCLGSKIFGVYAHLDFEILTKTDRLHLLFDREFDFLPIHLCLGKWSLSESIERYILEYKNKASENLSLIEPGQINEDVQSFTKDSAPIVSLLLYLCSQPEEIGSPDLKPHNPIPQKTKKGIKLFVAGNTKIWEVGQRIGVALSKAYSNISANELEIGASGSSKRPHVRRAHWHGFRMGPRINEDGSNIPADSRNFILHWLPPIPINVSNYDDLPAVIYPIKKVKMVT